MAKVHLDEGSVIDGFTIGKRVHKGGMAVFYEVSHPDHAIPMLMKVPMLNEGEDPAATDFIFANRKGRPLSEMTALLLMRRMDGFKGFTVHGLRSTFKDWATELTDYPRELIEEQLAHQLGAVERAYKRGSAHERRRPMMEAWAAFCAGETPAGAGNVVPLRTAAIGGQA